MSGFPLILAFVAAIVLMILAISKWKIHPFLSIMGISLVLGLVAGVPLVNRTAADGAVTPGLPTSSARVFPARSPASALSSSWCAHRHDPEGHRRGIEAGGYGHPCGGEKTAGAGCAAHGLGGFHPRVL
ncbi:MAG: hypothetical protein ACLRZH_03870 [Ruthenibacterium lactatiformans]